MIVPVLSVKDVDTSIAFYTEKLGFKQDMVLAGPDGVNSFAGVSLGNSTFMLSRAETPNVGQGVVFMIYIPEESDIDKIYSDVQAKGVPIVEPLKTEYWGDRVFSIKDPDGFYLSVSKTVQQADMQHVADVMSGKSDA